MAGQAVERRYDLVAPDRQNPAADGYLASGLVSAQVLKPFPVQSAGSGHIQQAACIGSIPIKRQQAVLELGAPPVVRLSSGLICDLRRIPGFGSVQAAE